MDDLAMRYRVVYPENFNRLSPHLSLSAMLLYSPAAMKRIRAFVLGRPAYIVPGTVGDEDRQLAVELGIPLLVGLSLGAGEESRLFVLSVPGLRTMI